MTVNAPQSSANVATFYTEFEKVVETAIHQPLNIETSVQIVKPPNYKMLTLFVYLFVATLLLFRLLRNCWHMLALGQKNYSTDYKGAKIALIRKKLLPHSFGRYIFINQEDYENGLINDEIFVHEWAHVYQRHTWDIVFIELLIVVGWFNPIFYMYRSKIRQNHEFLADQAVIGNNRNCIPAYQTILINNIPQIKKISFTSNFYYLITKQRIVMMTKTKTKKGALCRSFALIPVFTVAICVFSTKTIAQNDMKTLTEIIEVSVENPAVNNDRIENVSEELLTEHQEVVAQNEMKTLTETIKVSVENPAVNNDRIENVSEELLTEHQEIVAQNEMKTLAETIEVSVENVREIILLEQTNVCAEALSALNSKQRVNVAGDNVAFLASYSVLSAEDNAPFFRHVAFVASNRYRLIICTDEESANTAILQLVNKNKEVKGSSYISETGRMVQYFDFDCMETGAYTIIVSFSEDKAVGSSSAVASLFHVRGLQNE